MKIQKDYQDIEVILKDSIDTDKFDRQKRIHGWDQNKISNAKVMVIGVGATGNEVVKNLVLSGVGTIYIIDFDMINFSNLTRCVLFNSEAAEKNEYKVDIVKAASKLLNPDVNVIPIKKDLNDIDRNLYSECDVICSCLDNVEARLEANNYAYYYDVPFVDSGIDEYFGTVQVVYSKNKESACLQCTISDRDLEIMWKKFSCTGQEIKTEDQETTRKIATIITTTSIIGGIQSQQVLKFLLDVDYFEKYGRWSSQVGEPLIGKQLLYNGLTNTFNIIEKLKDPYCWTCSYKKPKS
ncbi:MAG: ThiF family adenylyltransferase [Candidatus Lokiarchaeota archaeon]|nr:ThiF family adenylyltransferase [Candidatus Lokiarchaeota archaeon]